MDKNEFAQIVADIRVMKGSSVNDGPTLTIVLPESCKGLSASNSPDSVYREKGNRWIAPYNSLIRAVARKLEFKEDPSEFYADTAADVSSRMVIKDHDPDTHDVVYIRTKRNYNINGPRKSRTQTKRKENTHMQNRKVTLTLITLLSGAPLTLQITGASKDATAWTRFLDVDNGAIEYDKSNWTKDVSSQNPDAVNAVDAMIQIEEDFVAGKLDKDAALEQFKDKYIAWVIAHLNANPGFVERTIPGLNCEDPMAAYREVESEVVYEDQK